MADIDITTRYPTPLNNASSDIDVSPSAAHECNTGDVARITPSGRDLILVSSHVASTVTLKGAPDRWGRTTDASWASAALGSGWHVYGPYAPRNFEQASGFIEVTITTAVNVHVSALALPGGDVTHSHISTPEVYEGATAPLPAASICIAAGGKKQGNPESVLFNSSGANFYPPAPEFYIFAEQNTQDAIFRIIGGKESVTEREDDTDFTLTGFTVAPNSYYFMGPIPNNQAFRKLVSGDGASPAVQIVDGGGAAWGQGFGIVGVR